MISINVIPRSEEVQDFGGNDKVFSIIFNDTPSINERFDADVASVFSQSAAHNQIGELMGDVDALIDDDKFTIEDLFKVLTKLDDMDHEVTKDLLKIISAIIEVMDRHVLLNYTNFLSEMCEKAATGQYANAEVEENTTDEATNFEAVDNDVEVVAYEEADVYPNEAANDVETEAEKDN